jgi:Ion transport protein
LNFLSAFHDDDLEIVDEPKLIVKEYVTGWFLPDFISVFPFELIIDKGGVNKLARFMRIGKVYKIIRMLKMVRLIKIAKVRNQLIKNLQEILKISVGMERLVFLLMLFLLFVHIVACIWIFIARID